MTDTPDLSTVEGRRAEYAKVDAFHARRRRDYKPTDQVDRLVHGASMNAAGVIESEGLQPVRDDEGEFRYQVQQGLRAAAHGREDAASTFLLMKPMLYYLQRIERTLLVVIALLALILWRVW